MPDDRNFLVLSRRHTLKCRAANQLRSKTPRPTGRTKDICNCPICADGFLRHEAAPIKNLSLRTNQWGEADLQATDLLLRGRIESRIESRMAVEVATDTGHTVTHAVNQYLASRGPKSTYPLQEDTLRDYEIHLRQRLLPFCRANNIKYVADFDNFSTLEKYVLSWSNLNPHKNRRGLAPVDRPLADATKRLNVARLSNFLKYCKKNDWCKYNRCDDLTLRPEKATKKYGLTLEEYGRLIDAVIAYSARPGARRPVGELLALLELARWSGLRVSDLARFNDSQLIRNEDNTVWLVVLYFMEKTGYPVTVPIPDHVAHLFLSLKPRCVRDGKKYWFWNGFGNFKSATNYIQQEITKVQKLAQKEIRFTHHASPHTLRHTFAIQHLNAETDIYQVSQWLGHTDIRTTQKHYSHAIKATRQLAERVGLESITKQLAAAAMIRWPNV